MASVEIPEKFAALGLTYDDVLLLPGESDLAPSDIDTTTRLTREISVRVPLISAAMDTVTESRMAIAMAREGGIGVLHRNLSIEDQARQVDLVKRTQTGIISNPVTIGPDATLEELDRICGEYRVSGLPVVDLGEGVVRGAGDRVGDHAGLGALDQVHLAGLVLGGEVAVQDADAAGAGHGDRHPRLGDGVHGGGDERDRQPDAAGEPGAGVHLGGHDVRGARDEQDVVVGQPQRGELGGQFGAELVGAMLVGLHVPPPSRLLRWSAATAQGTDLMVGGPPGAPSPRYRCRLSGHARPIC